MDDDPRQEKLQKSLDEISRFVRTGEVQGMFLVTWDGAHVVRCRVVGQGATSQAIVIMTEMLDEVRREWIRSALEDDTNAPQIHVIDEDKE